MRIVGDYMAARHAHRYDFDRAPLYSLRAFVGDDGVDLVFAFHHAILDGWSVANLIRELVQDYLFHLGVDVPPIDTEVHSTTMLAEHARLEREALEERRRTGVLASVPWTDRARRRWNPTSPMNRRRPPIRL